jgi:hypothetical protein
VEECRVYDEVLYQVDADIATLVNRVELSDVELQERAHLQEWILAHPVILGPGVEIITSEFDRWQTSAGDPVLDRLDILAVDPTGRIVVAELKRGIAPHTVHMQALNYAAMVSRLTPEDIAELYSVTRNRGGQDVDVDSALTILTTEKLLTAESIRSPRIVLVASDFPPPVTATVVWLNEQGVDISLIRFRSYRLGDGQLVVSFSRLFPVPDVEEFTIGRRTDQPAAAVITPGPPWDEPALRRLAAQANAPTLTLLDLCAAEEASTVTIRDVAERAGCSDASVRAGLAGLTRSLKHPKYGYAQTTWPMTVTVLPGGLASYHMDPDLAAIWRTIRPMPNLAGESDGTQNTQHGA